MGALPILTPSRAGDRVLSYTVSFNLQTTDFIPGIRLLLNTVSEKGGYLEAATVRGRDMRELYTERSADFSLRVPSELLTEFIIIVENSYNILFMNQAMHEHTAEYRQTGTRLDYLREQEARLSNGLRDEEITDSERRALERELIEVRIMINDFFAQQTAIDHSVNYSTVTITLFEVVIFEEVIVEPEPPATFSTRLTNQISSSVAVFVAFCQGLLLVIITLAPVILILAFFGAVILIIFHLIKKRGKKQYQPTPVAPAPAPAPTPASVPAPDKEEK